jgi:hypothetical protein
MVGRNLLLFAFGLLLLLITADAALAPQNLLTENNRNYILEFDWAAPSTNISAGKAKVFWNGRLKKNIKNVQDDDIHHEVIPIIAYKGNNCLQFEGADSTDNTGLMIDNVLIYKEGDESKTNLVINGDFSKPKVNPWRVFENEIKGWTAKEI